MNFKSLDFISHLKIEEDHKTLLMGVSSINYSFYQNLFSFSNRFFRFKPDYEIDLFSFKSAHLKARLHPLSSHLLNHQS
jgi:hypothetical protein